MPTRPEILESNNKKELNDVSNETVALGQARCESLLTTVLEEIRVLQRDVLFLRHLSSTQRNDDIDHSDVRPPDRDDQDDSDDRDVSDDRDDSDDNQVLSGSGDNTPPTYSLTQEQREELQSILTGDEAQDTSQPRETLSPRGSDH